MCIHITHWHKVCRKPQVGSGNLHASRRELMIDNVCGARLQTKNTLRSMLHTLILGLLLDSSLHTYMGTTSTYVSVCVYLSGDGS